MDRANPRQALAANGTCSRGKVESVEINTGYVHAQGLLVPIVGKLSLVREGGEADHFLLKRAE